MLNFHLIQQPQTNQKKFNLKFDFESISQAQFQSISIVSSILKLKYHDTSCRTAKYVLKLQHFPLLFHFQNPMNANRRIEKSLSFYPSWSKVIFENGLKQFYLVRRYNGISSCFGVTERQGSSISEGSSAHLDIAVTVRSKMRNYFEHR